MFGDIQALIDEDVIIEEDEDEDNMDLDLDDFDEDLDDDFDEEDEFGDILSDGNEDDEDADDEGAEYGHDPRSSQTEYGSVEVIHPRRYFKGARNAETVKDCNFLGGRSEKIASGSDDGNFFVWDSMSGRLEGVWKGDGSVVNGLS